jgi:hypothetical protein
MADELEQLPADDDAAELEIVALNAATAVAGRDLTQAERRRVLAGVRAVADDETSDDAKSASDDDSLFGDCRSMKLRDFDRTMSAGSDDDDGDAPPINEAGKFELLDDPNVAIAINNAHRRADIPDGAGSDLWTLDQVSSVFPRAYMPSSPILAPMSWRQAKKMTQAEYTDAVKASPILRHVLAAGPIDNVVIAGGAAVWAFGDRATEPADVDLFIYGLDGGDEMGLWLKVDEICRKLCRAFMKIEGEPGRKNNITITQSVTPGLAKLRITFTDGARSSFSDNKSEIGVDIILRAFASVSAILHGFDIPAACVAFDWHTTYLTTLGAYAHVFRVNPVEPAYRSLTYERRLKKYTERGYALGLRHLSLDQLRVGTLTLPHCALVIKAARGYQAYGELTLPTGIPNSDYDTQKNQVIRRRRNCGLTEDLVIFGEQHLNTRRLAASETAADFRPIALGYSETAHILSCTCHRCFRRSRRGIDGFGSRTISFAKYARDGAPTFGDILDRADLEARLVHISKHAVGKDGRVSAANLRRIFGLTPAELTKLTEASLSVLAANPKSKLNLVNALAPFRDRILAKYDAAAARPIAWWIKVDPSRQYTASLNPRIENPAEWYGAAFAESAPASNTDIVIESLRAQLEARQASSSRVFDDGSCALCGEPIADGANVITLACGHRFHWMEMGETWCGGIWRGIEHDRHSCPTCCAPFNGEDTSVSEVPTVDYEAIRNGVPVVVDWSS